MQQASVSVFDRLVVRGAENIDRSTAIIERVRKGVSEDDKTTHPCFMVSRGDSKRSSPFQIQVREGLRSCSEARQRGKGSLVRATKAKGFNG